MAIKDLPVLLRPREKAERYGFDALSDNELLAIIINSGNKGYDALTIANALLDYSHGLSNLHKLSQKELKQIKGISKVKGIQLTALFTLFDRIRKHHVEEEELLIDNKYIYKKYVPMLRDVHQEELIVVVLSKSKRILFETTLYKGTNNNVAFSIKEILRIVIIHEGYYFYLIHNHPNNSLSPSVEDMVLTMRIKHEAEG